MAVFQRRPRGSTDFVPPSSNVSTNGVHSDSDEPAPKTSSVLSSYSTDPYTSSAQSVSEEIKVDKNECRLVISKYGADPNELLHLLEQWTQQLIFGYRQSRERFKLIMKEKWERGELTSIKADENANRRLVYVQMQKLTEWQRNAVNTFKRPLEENQVLENIKQIVHNQTDELLQTMNSVFAIQQFVNEASGPSVHLSETMDQLKRLKKINQKQYNTICIIGLEKAGKSSFINALLGFELLPFKIERCTQIQTILRPPSPDNPDLFATIEFYPDEEFDRLIEKLPREKDEGIDAFQRRVAQIRQTRLDVLPSASLIRSYTASDEGERRRVTQILHPFIAEVIYLVIVKHAVIYTSQLPGENYILLDVPGCDSPIAEHRSSAIDAIQNADAFLFLTDGQRPSLTNDQLTLLDEIREGHFEGMKRAFAVITKLDLCQTTTKYREHREKTRNELLQKGFLPEHIFAVAANVSLLEETRSDPEQLQTIKERIRSYENLEEGFQRCKRTLNEYIEYHLPYSRYRLLMNIAQQKISRYVQDALQAVRRLIPIDPEQISFAEYIKQINAEKWDEIFERERFQPVLALAASWQKETLASKRKECTATLTKYFFDRFQLSSAEIVTHSHPIERLMFEQHDVALFQMNPHEIDTREREKIVLNMFQAVKTASADLSIFMFEKYVNHLERMLNDICPEQGDLFQADLTAEQCAIEVRTLIGRVTHPVILCTLRWPHGFQQMRIRAVEELTRVAPIVAFNVLENSQSAALNGPDAPNLANDIDRVLEEIKSKNKSNEILFALFRR